MNAILISYIYLCIKLIQNFSLVLVKIFNVDLRFSFLI